MNCDHDKLKKLFRGYARAMKPLNRDRCPSVSEIVESFEPSASARRKRRVIDHIATCLPCRQEFMVLVERQNQEEESTDAEPRHHPRFLPASLRFAGALLGLALIVISIAVIRHQWELSMALRSTRPGITLLDPNADRSVSDSTIFRWHGQAASEYYILELFDETLLPIWASDKLTTAQGRIPASVRSQLLPGGKYFWMVTGYVGNLRIEESPLRRFIVKR